MIFSLMEIFEQLLPHTMNYVVLKLNVPLLQMHLMQSQVVMMPSKMVT